MKSAGIKGIEHESISLLPASCRAKISDSHLSSVAMIVGAVVITTTVGTMPFRVAVIGPVVTVTALVMGRGDRKRVRRA